MIERDENKLDTREAAFVIAYLLCKVASKAALEAGYSESTAKTHAYQWVGESRIKCPPNKRHVWDAVKQAIDDQQRAAKIDAAFVLTRLAAMIDADPVDIIDEVTGCYKKIHDWPITWRRMLSAADVQELFAVIEGGNQGKIGEVVKYKFIDKLKAYEMLGKHVNVQAFKDKLDLGGSIGISIDGEDADL